MLQNQNERILKIENYYIWEADVIVKIVDKVTGEEI